MLPIAFPPLLAGIRVLDASRVLAGPYCGQLLGELGADVIKIERPGQGDDTRHWGPPFHPTGPSAYFLSCNHNKRGIALDLTRPRGRELFDALLLQSDVVLENFLPATAERLGLSSARLLSVQPRVIVCSISGFGHTGPLADVPGYDFAIQALSGLMSITGPVGGEPSKVGVAITDVLTGLYAATAILACLIARGRTGQGYHIDLSLLDCAVAAQVNVVQAYLTRCQMGLTPSEAVPPRQGNAHLQIVPYELLPTADGWLVLAVGNDGQWQRLAQSIAPDLADDARYATNALRVRHREQLMPRLHELFRQRSTQTWQELLTGIEVPHAPVWTYAEMFQHPHALAHQLKVSVSDAQGRPVDLLGSPFRIGSRESVPSPPLLRMPPGLGEHTAEVLSELCGLDATEIDQLRQERLIE